MTLKRHNATRDIVVTPTITAGAYSANDAVGGKLTFTGALGKQNWGAVNIACVITDKGKQDAALALVLFGADFTPIADNAAFDPSDADLIKIIGYISISTYLSWVDNSMAIGVATIPMVSGSASGTIYGQLYTTDTPTYTSASDLQVRLVLQGDI